MSAPPGLGGHSIGGAITPFRKTVITYDPSETQTVRPPWSLFKEADRIGRLTAVDVPASIVAAAPTNRSLNMLLLPGPAWVIQPTLFDPAQFGVNPDCDPIPTTDWTLAPGIVGVPWWRPPTDLPGVTVNPNVVAAPSSQLERRKFGSSLVADVAAWPMVYTGSDTIQFDRIASGSVTYPPNCRFRLQWQQPDAQLLGTGSILTFYFGGYTGAQPAGQFAGAFAVRITNGGIARLYEYNGNGFSSGWQERFRFLYAGGGGLVPGTLHAIDFFPYADKYLAIRCLQGQFSPNVVANFNPALAPIPGQPSWMLYKDDVSLTGVASRTSMTGPGTVRLDLRQDLRIPLWVFALKFPPTGILYDEPMSIDTAPFDSQAQINTSPLLWQSNTGDWNVAELMYDAGSGQSLTLAPNQPETGIGFGIADPTQANYFTKFTFTSSPDKYQTPALFSCEWTVPGGFTTYNGAGLVGGNNRSVNITGPDIDPTHETASTEVEDVSAVLLLLDIRGRIRTRIQTTCLANNPNVLSTLFDGEMTRDVRRKRGRPKLSGIAGLGGLQAYPSQHWETHDGTHGGMWGRLKEAKFEGRRSYALDPNVPANPQTGQAQCWKITDALRDGFHRGGFDDTRLDIPDNPLRFFPVSKERAADLIIDPTCSVVKAIYGWLRDYLGQWMVWDGNAQGTGASVRGMWRLLVNPDNTFSPIFAFNTAQNLRGRLNAYPHVFGDTDTWIQDGSYHEFCVAPEFNHLTVTATGNLEPAHSGPGQLTQTWYNPASWNYDGAHPPDPLSLDYLGFRNHVTRFDPALQTPEAVNWVLLRTALFAGFGQLWAQFRAPLVLVVAAGDQYSIAPRPLRLNDVVTVRGKKGIIRSCNPRYTNDRLQMADYEVLYFRVPGD